MNLNFGSNLKKLRRDRDMTQEQLANALGLSDRAISRYETNSAYPDIEMLPVIAGFFGVTVDTLLGVSSMESKARRQEYFSRYMAAEDPETQLEILNKLRAEFPEDWDAVYQTMLTIGRLPEEKRDMNFLRQIAKNALKRCTDPVYHDKLIFAYLESEDDEKSALDFISEHSSERDVSKLQLMKNYYQGRDDVKYRALYQYQTYCQLEQALCFMSLYRNGGDVRAAIDGCELALDILKKVSGSGDLTKPDKWIDSKLLVLLRLSNNYLFFDEREKGFKALDTALTLIENAINLPDGTKITCGSKMFEMLDCVTQKGVNVYDGSRDYLCSYHGLVVFMKYEKLPFEGKCPIDEWNFYPTNYTRIVTTAYWHNFKRYRDDPEYKKYAERAKKSAEITERKNVEYILKQGVVQDPKGGSLCAVKSNYNYREGRELLYILIEEPGSGFKKALEQFKAEAELRGITEAEPVMAVTSEREEIKVPEEVAEGIKEIIKALK